MPIYEQPTKVLMKDWAKEALAPGQTFEKSAPIAWFRERFPKIKSNTVGMHVEGMSVNSASRRHHPSIKRGSGHDLFFKLGRGRYRLWESESDPQPIYKDDLDSGVTPDAFDPEEEEEEVAVDEPALSRKFAFEKDLQNYLVKNLGLIEPGLELYDEEGITGVEFAAGGRSIDILAVDRAGGFVVIELKVSRGYDRVVGQLLRYMNWVERNMETKKPVRGVIVASEITEDLLLACARIEGVRLIEYEISFSLRPKVTAAR